MWDQNCPATPGFQSWQAGRVTLDPFGIGGWEVGGGLLCCRVGALGLARQIWGVRRLPVIPHSGSSTWDLFSCWMGRQAAQEDSHFRPASVAVNASRQRRADTRPRASSLNTPVWTTSLPPLLFPVLTRTYTHTHSQNNDFFFAALYKDNFLY